MITLYHRPKTRSSRFLFLLEELGAPYRIQIVTTRNRDGTGAPDPANPHPHGKVPAISDDGVVVFESPAIALYLTDKFPQSGLGPLVGDPQRGAYLSWLAYYGDVFEPAIMSKVMKVEVPRGTAGWVACPTRPATASGLRTCTTSEETVAPPASPVLTGISSRRPAGASASLTDLSTSAGATPAGSGNACPATASSTSRAANAMLRC